MSLKHKKIAFNLKQRLLITIIVACAIPFAFGAAYLNTFFETWFYTFNQENTGQMLSQISDYMYLALDKQMIELTNEISNDRRTLNADSTIRNYDQIEERILEDLSATEVDIASCFSNMKQNHEDILYVFLGLDDGSYMEFPEFKPTNNYDPRVRPWYLAAIESDETLISQPYVSKVTNEMVISFTKKIRLNNGQQGVIGIAVSIKNLTDKIGRIKIDQEGYIIVLDEAGRIIVSPKNPEWLLKTSDEINETKITEALSQEAYIIGNLDGEEKLLYAKKDDTSRYTFVAVLQPTLYRGKLQEITYILIGILVLTYALLMYVINYVANRFTGPIIMIANKLQNIHEDEVDILIDEDMIEFNHYHDEIGTISNAIHVLIKNINKNFETLIKKNEEIMVSNSLLASSEEELICQLEEIEDKKRYIEHLAMHDALTDIPNRRYFYEELGKSILRQEKGVVILMDIDNFKGVNDTLGHKIGDDLLIAVAHFLQSKVDENSIVSRFGGDEFFILKKGVEKEHVMEYIAQLQARFEEPFVINEHKLDIKFSIGASLYPEDSSDVHQLIMNADLAMYFVKNKNKNDVAFYEDKLLNHVIEKTEISNLLKEALNHDGFKLVYQPIIHAKTGKVHSYEALLRLKDYTIPPSKFIAIAEEEGTILAIGRKVLEMVLMQLNEWIRIGIDVKPISINFSARQLYDYDFFDFLVAKLNEYGIEPSLIEIEMTENVFFENSDITLEFLNRLRNIGIKILIDDFGTGYSSLGYLTTFPIDVVKLDKSINARFLNTDSIDVLKSIIMLVHSLKLEVVAEGIETLEQFYLMESQGCNYIQGYVFSRPLELEDVIPSLGKSYI